MLFIDIGSLFYPIFDKSDWPQYDGAIIVPSYSMKHELLVDQNKVIFILRWIQRKLKLNKRVDYASNWVTIDVLVLLDKQMIRVDALY